MIEKAFFLEDRDLRRSAVVYLEICHLISSDHPEHVAPLPHFLSPFWWAATLSLPCLPSCVSVWVSETGCL